MQETGSLSGSTANLSEISGYVGLAPLHHANINIIDVSEFSNPILLEQTTTDETGYFNTQIDLSAASRIMIVASGGSMKTIPGERTSRKRFGLSVNLYGPVLGGAATIRI